MAKSLVRGFCPKTILKSIQHFMWWKMVLSNQKSLSFSPKVSNSQDLVFWVSSFESKYFSPHKMMKGFENGLRIKHICK